MTIGYHIYQNDGQGGPVDYSALVATVPATSWAGPALAAPSDTTFAVRAYRVEDGLEESNTDATARVVLDPAGIQQGPPPNRCLAITATPGPGQVRVRWFHSPGGMPIPDQFSIWVQEGPGPIDYGGVPLVLPMHEGVYQALGGHFAFTAPGLPGGPYVVSVRASSGGVLDESTNQRAVTIPDAAPGAPEGLIIAQSPPGLRTGRAIPGTAP